MLCYSRTHTPNREFLTLTIEAYTFRNENLEEDDDDEEEEEEDGEDDDDPDDALEDDQDADETDYAEVLSMSEGLRGLGGPADDDNEDYEEIQFRAYNTPLDDRANDGQEHIEFYRALHGFQLREPAIYARVTSSLDVAQSQSLGAILQQGIHLIGAKESQAVSAQGGFNFGASCSVPTSFNFAKS